MEILPHPGSKATIRKDWRGRFGVSLIILAVVGVLPLAYFLIYLSRNANPESDDDGHAAEYFTAIGIAAVTAYGGYSVAFSSPKEKDRDVRNPSVNW